MLISICAIPFLLLPCCKRWNALVWTHARYFLEVAMNNWDRLHPIPIGRKSLNSQNSKAMLSGSPEVVTAWHEGKVIFELLMNEFADQIEDELKHCLIALLHTCDHYWRCLRNRSWFRSVRRFSSYKTISCLCFLKWKSLEKCIPPYGPCRTRLIWTAAGPSSEWLKFWLGKLVLFCLHTWRRCSPP